MSNPIVAVSCDDSNYEAILTAIRDITRAANLTFAGDKLFEIPTAQELDAAGVPFLAVRQGELSTWALNGADYSVVGQRQMGWMEPVWNIEVFSIFTYSPQTPNDAIAAKYLASMISAYTLNVNLGGTCATSDTIAGKNRTGLTYLGIEGTLFRAAKVTLRAVEQLQVNYFA